MSLPRVGRWASILARPLCVSVCLCLCVNCSVCTEYVYVLVWDARAGQVLGYLLRLPGLTPLPSKWIPAMVEMQTATNAGPLLLSWRRPGL